MRESHPVSVELEDPSPKGTGKPRLERRPHRPLEALQRRFRERSHGSRDLDTIAVELIES